jgi:hypothetical protein
VVTVDACPDLQELRAKAALQCGNPEGRFYAECMEDVVTTCNLDDWVIDATVAEDDFNKIDEDVIIPEDPDADIVDSPSPSPVSPAGNSCGCDEYRNGASASDAVTCRKNQQEQGLWKCMPPSAGDDLCPGDHTRCVQTDLCDRSKSIVCSSSGDPHVRTFVGRRSHPMGQGEYVLAVCGSFRVHACHEPITRPGISKNNGFVIDTQWGLVKITRSGASIPSGVGIAIQGRRRRTITFPDGSMVSGNVRSLSVKFTGECCARTSGLCGAFSPALNYANIFTDASGNYRDYPNSRWRGPFGGEFQSVFADSWKVTDPSQRLFTEAECPTGTTPQLPEEPPVSQCDNVEELRAKAEVQCGNPNGRFHADCVEDVLTTCDLDEWVNETKDAEDDFDEVDDDVTIPEADPSPSPSQSPASPSPSASPGDAMSPSPEEVCEWNEAQLNPIVCPNLKKLLDVKCFIRCSQVVCPDMSDSELEAACRLDE